MNKLERAFVLALTASALAGGANVIGKVAEFKREVRALHEAVAAGNENDLLALLYAGADPNVEDRYGQTLLHEAARAGHADIVRILLELGADPNVEDRYGTAPLRVAAMTGHVDIAKLLVEHGADLNAKDNAGWTPLRVAVSNGHAVIARLLREAAETGNENESCSPKHPSAQALHASLPKFAPNVDPSRLLLVPSPDAQRLSAPVIPPLHKPFGAVTDQTFAAQGDKHPPWFLHKPFGAVTDQTAETAVGIEPFLGEFPRAERRIECSRRPFQLNGICVSVVEPGPERDNYGNTWSHHSAWHGFFAGNSDAKNVVGQTPLHFAAWKGHNGTVLDFLKAAADPNVRDNDCNTPLHWAAWNSRHYGHVLVVRELIEWGADPTVVNGTGKTPLDYATRGSLEAAAAIVRLLEDASATR